MLIEIVSMTAAVHGRGTITWRGEIEMELGLSDAQTLEQIFRLFNRVDEADSLRLNTWQYGLPSLSVGDLVHFNLRTWRCKGTGWELVTGNPEAIRELMLG